MLTSSKLCLPAEEIYRPAITIKHDSINYGLNMYFKKYHTFSSDPDQAGGQLAPNQTFLSTPWGHMGCPVNKQENITDYVTDNLKDVVFCRYGMDYLKSFPRTDDLAIGSFRINLDYLIFQRQKHLNTDNNANLVGMSFLKTKGQIEMNRQLANQKNIGDKSPILPQSNMIVPYYRSGDSSSLQFDSVFESGNLAIALQVSANEYNCILQNDINTNGHTQWFYFKVAGTFAKKQKVRFNLINLYKPKSLYQYGMKVLTLDVGRCKNVSGPEELPKWQRSCSDICYIQNHYTNDNCPNGLFQMQFTYEFEKGSQEIYFAHSMPYTYTMLNTYLNENVTKEKAKRQTLCHSLAGNKIEYLYITNKNKVIESNVAEAEIKKEPLSSASPKKVEKIDGKTPQPTKRQKSLTKTKKKPPVSVEKQVILLTSRVHPGETNASWMMQGLLDSLLNPSDEERELVRNLKDHFEFYIVPMLNVDGVINGNYRCSLAACDLNRQWLKPGKTLHPGIYYTKKLCQTLIEQEKKQFFFYLDFHGHSAKKNIFQYGNKTENWAPSRHKSSCSFQPSVFPLMLSKQFDYFNFQDCTYTMPKSKESTARITMFHKLRIPFVFTLEASFAGANRGALAGKHFSQRDFMNVGKYVLKAFWEVKKLELNKVLLKQITEEANSQVKNENEDEGSDEGCSSSEEDMEPPASSTKALLQMQDRIQDHNDGSPANKIQDPRKKVNNQMHDDERADRAGNICGPCFTATLNSSRKQKNLQTLPVGAPPKTSNKKEREKEKEPTPQLPLKQSNFQLKTMQAQPEKPTPNTHAQGQISNTNSRKRFESLRQNAPNSLLIPVRRSTLHRLDQSTERERVQSLDAIPVNESDQLLGLQGQASQNLSGLQTAQPSSADVLKRAGTLPARPQDRQSNSASESTAQELFQMFNAEIEKSFAESQQYLDEIFRQNARKIIDIKNQAQNSAQTQPGYGFRPGATISAQKTSSKAKDKTSSNWHLQQFIHEHKQNIKQNSSTLLGNTFFQPPVSQLQQQTISHQIHAFQQLQKLHQMQKLNQMAQMQFFRQQAEMLLSQNLTEQQQLELFQQFSYYQSQIQIQSQQYQMMLNQSLHGSNMQMINNQNNHAPHHRKTRTLTKVWPHSNHGQWDEEQMFNSRGEYQEIPLDDYLTRNSTQQRARHSVANHGAVGRRMTQGQHQLQVFSPLLKPEQSKEKFLPKENSNEPQSLADKRVGGSINMSPQVGPQGLLKIKKNKIEFKNSSKGVRPDNFQEFKNMTLAQPEQQQMQFQEEQQACIPASKPDMNQCYMTNPVTSPAKHFFSTRGKAKLRGTSFQMNPPSQSYPHTHSVYNSIPAPPTLQSKPKQANQISVTSTPPIQGRKTATQTQSLRKPLPNNAAQ